MKIYRSCLCPLLFHYPQFIGSWLFWELSWGKFEHHGYHSKGNFSSQITKRACRLKTCYQLILTRPNLHCRSLRNFSLTNRNLISWGDSSNIPTINEKSKELNHHLKIESWSRGWWNLLECRSPWWSPWWYLDVSRSIWSSWSLEGEIQALMLCDDASENHNWSVLDISGDIRRFVSKSWKDP